MKDYRTNFQGDYDHPCIIVSVLPEFDAGVEWLLDFFTSEFRRGVVFQSGETVQIGWMICMLKSNDMGDLEVWEPDFESIPIKWVRGVNRTLRDLLIQREVCKQLGVEPNLPSLRQFGLISLNYAAGVEGSMTRRESHENNSGWFIEVLDGENVGAKHASLYEIALQDYRVVPFLGLPSGSRVRYSEAGIWIACDEVLIDAGSNKFLNRLHANWV